MRDWLYSQDKSRTLWRAKRRLQRKPPQYGERHFPWHESRRLRWARVFLAALIVGNLLLLTAGGAVAVGGYQYYNSQLPSIDLIFDRQIPQSTLIYDRNGNLLFEVYDPNQGHRILVPLSQVPEVLRNATLAAEDPNFYVNPGLDPMAIVRALFLNFQAGGIVSGASTLPMQLVRNTLLSEQERYDRSYLRKMKEALLSFNLAMSYSKNDILEMYLNQVYYGHQAYGVEAASLQYFGKDVKDLTLPEAAMIAGLPQAPTDYDPYTNAKLAVLRQHYVLDQMVKYGFISKAQADEAKQEPLKLGSLQTHFDQAPHFSLYIRDLLVQRFGHDAVYYGGLRVVTTLDLQKQDIATETVRAHLAQIGEVAHATDAALVSIDPRNGEVLAMVGSPDFYNDAIAGQVNMAVAARQPGSSLKPFNYAVAFRDLGYVPATIVYDAPTCFPVQPGSDPYCPHNWDFKFHGPMLLRAALAASMNIPAIMLLANEGIPAFLDILHRSGITTIDKPAYNYGLAITLGAAEVTPLDETFAYTMLANNGQLIGEKLPADQQRAGFAPYGPVTLKSVTDYKGNVLYTETPQPPIQVIPAEYAYLVTAAISDDSSRVLTYGRHSYLELSRPNAAKTGTTENRNDGWTLGYTPDLVTGVWVGNADNSPMITGDGVSSAGKIFHDYMEAALKGTPATYFTVPPNVREGTVCGHPNDVYVVGREPVCVVTLNPKPLPVRPKPEATPQATPTATGH